MNVLHFAIFMNTYNDLFIFTCHQIPLSLHLSQCFPPQPGPPVKILENKHDVNLRPALVAQVCNPSYSGGRDQEDSSWKPSWANSSPDPISKNLQKARGIGPELKPQYWNNKKMFTFICL
jgi:hypothetical protein